MVTILKILDGGRVENLSCVSAVDGPALRLYGEDDYTWKSAPSGTMTVYEETHSTAKISGLQALPGLIEGPPRNQNHRCSNQIFIHNIFAAALAADGDVTPRLISSNKLTVHKPSLGTCV